MPDIRNEGKSFDGGKEPEAGDGFQSKWTLSIVAIVKNEKEYLLEWLAHYRCLGVDYFYIADNGSDDGTFELLQDLEKSGVLTLADWPLKEKAQHRWYNHALEEYGAESCYMGFVDADEFIGLSENACLKSKVSDLLAHDDVGALACEWRLYGSSGHERRTSGLVIERFVRAGRSERQVNRHVKSIVKPCAVERMWAHSADLKHGYHYVSSSGGEVAFKQNSPQSGRSASVLPELIVVRHYATKSLQEYVEKKQRKGRANMGPSHERPAAYFKNHDFNDIEAPFSGEWVHRVRNEMVALRSLLR